MTTCQTNPIQPRASLATTPAFKTDAAYFAFTLWSYRAAADACAFDDLSFWRAVQVAA